MAKTTRGGAMPIRRIVNEFAPRVAQKTLTRPAVSAVVRNDGQRSFTRPHRSENSPVSPGGSAAHQPDRSEEHTFELQSLMRISYAVFCLKQQKIKYNTHTYTQKISKSTPIT